MNDSYMRKFLLFFFSIFVLTVMAEKTIYLHKTDGTKETYLASAVDSIGFVNVHTITFNANGGTGSMDVLCVKEGESIALPVNGFSYTDVAFAGWNTKKDGSGTAYTDKATVKPTANMTLYAQWVNANVYTITFNANGGEGSMAVISLKEGNLVTLTANAFTKTNSTFAGWNTAANGSGTAYADKATVKPTANMTLYAQWVRATTGIENGHEWVDLGLPSGTKWATCNVGANDPEDYGYYFAWGETAPKSRYDKNSYKWCVASTSSFTKYCTSYSDGTVDNKTTLDLSDDAAYVNWGTSWRMPTKAEQEELSNTSYTTWTSTTQNGVKGYKVTSKSNGNSIFLPATGYFEYSTLLSVGYGGYFWSNSLEYISSYACSLGFYGMKEGFVFTEYRYYGQSVRPVLR